MSRSATDRRVGDRDQHPGFSHLRHRRSQAHRPDRGCAAVQEVLGLVDLAPGRHDDHGAQIRRRRVAAQRPAEKLVLGRALRHAAAKLVRERDHSVARWDPREPGCSRIRGEPRNRGCAIDGREYPDVVARCDAPVRPHVAEKGRECSFYAGAPWASRFACPRRGSPLRRRDSEIVDVDVLARNDPGRRNADRVTELANVLPCLDLDESHHAVGLDRADGARQAVARRPRVAGAVFGVAVWGMLGFFNGIGRPRITLIITIATTLANVAFNYLFIFRLQWGVAGSGWATTAAQALGRQQVVGQRPQLALQPFGERNTEALLAALEDLRRQPIGQRRFQQALEPRQPFETQARRDAADELDERLIEEGRAQLEAHSDFGRFELDLRELLSRYEFPGDDIPIVRVSALKALEGDPEGAEGVTKLLDAVDNFIPEPERKTDLPFLMPVEDVFSITGRGTVATGRIEKGKIKVGEEVSLIGFNSDKKTVITGVEMFRKLLDDGQAGDNVGLLLRGINKEDVERGMVLAKPGSITPHTKFNAEVYVLTKEEGGRHTPFFKGYRPQFFFRTTDVTGSVELPEGMEMVMPGDNVQMTIELIAPIAMDEGLRFAIREGGRTVGAGVVTKILQ